MGRIRFLICIIALLATSHAAAAFVDGRQLLEFIEAGNRIDAVTEIDGDALLDTQFTGYTQGVVDVLVRLNLLCVSSKISSRQLQETVVRFAKANSQMRNRSGAEIIYLALVKTHSCKKR